MAFYTISIIARFMQGASDAIATPASISIIIQEFPKSFDQYIGLYFAVVGLGVAMGPFLASFVFTLVSYTTFFYCFATYLSIVRATCVSLIPERISSTDTEGTSESKHDVSYL
jgi:MFS family permease